MNISRVIILYFLCVNAVTFVAFGIDKAKAIRHKWRIPERTLLGLALIGGAVGGILGMMVFRHKIRKLRFVVGIPVMLLLHIALLWLAFR